MRYPRFTKNITKKMRFIIIVICKNTELNFYILIHNFSQHLYIFSKIDQIMCKSLYFSLNKKRF